MKPAIAILAGWFLYKLGKSMAYEEVKEAFDLEVEESPQAKVAHLQ